MKTHILLKKCVTLDKLLTFDNKNTKFWPFHFVLCSLNRNFALSLGRESEKNRIHGTYSS